MKLPPIPMPLFFGFGSLAFAIQALMSAIIYFNNLSLQTIFTTISVWAMILFNCMVSYLFFTMYQDQKPAGVELDEGFDPKAYVDEALNK